MPHRFPDARSARLRPLLLLGFVLGAALARLVPHPPNLTPVGALALFGGATFRSRRAALLVPLGAMLLSDALLGLVNGWSFGWMRVVVYGCLAVSVGIGRMQRGALGPRSVATGSLASALVFFLVTNLAVWVAGGTYPRDLGGLLACYAAALPFFGNSVAGYALHGTLLFGGLALLQRRFPVLVLPGVARPEADGV